MGKSFLKIVVLLTLLVVPSAMAQMVTDSKVGEKSELNYTPDFVDPRDGKSYETVKIGDQVWMARNLNYATENSFCYDNDQGHCDRYGRLYLWVDALNACPEGWHLPAKDDFLALIKKAGGKQNRRDPASWDYAGKALKSTAGWFYKGKSQFNGKNSLGFNVLPVGERSISGEFREFASWTNFWSSTQSTDLESSAVSMGFHALGNDAMLGGSTKAYGFSVRCLKD